jgi:CheY-like chemotaxis protein
MATSSPGRAAHKPPTSVLCIDDLADYLPVRRAFLESQGYHVITATSGSEGLEVLGKNKIDVVVLDYRMPGMDGGQVALLIRQQWQRMPIILLSGYPKEIPVSVTAIVNTVVTKGQNPSALLGAIEAALPEIILEPRTETASRESIEHTKKRIQHMREAIEDRRQKIGRRRRNS